VGTPGNGPEIGVEGLMSSHHLLLKQSSSEAPPQTAEKPCRGRAALRCRTVSPGPASRGRHLL